MGLVVSRDADTPISDLQGRPVWGAVQVQLNGAGGGRIFSGIGEEIGEERIASAFLSQKALTAG